ncbi:beta/gamma crystallin domain-containing protein [Paenibacillus sp. SC116]|uniref:beta/gamma crystallin domain-containing protein n=1 Tax=Paenibacillus sp. SC116 TaxID=2968986 RepID=UPI00215A3C9B|nr:beta/gamma crystallin domain-containing protein [Paenibacillus sp. SC116]MCR8844965.1 beta/gamma crystallin domain-containing protein [Paenibacillus sp. SC116]
MKLVKKIAMGATVSAFALSLMVSSALAQSGQTSQASNDVNALSPIIFEGVTYAPSHANFKEVLDKVQHTVVERDGKSYGYVDIADADKHINKILTVLSEEVGTLESNYVSSFWVNTSYTGDKLDLASGRTLATLGSWNDKISSVKSANLRGTRLYEHSNLQGDSIYLSPNENVSNLTSRNFNDKASSLKVY